MGKLTGNDVIMKEQRVMKWTETENGAYLFPGCVVTGDVTMGKAASVWYNAVVRGDMAPITIGEGSNIQDNAVVHVDNGFPTVIGQWRYDRSWGDRSMAARWRMTVLSVWGRFS